LFGKDLYFHFMLTKLLVVDDHRGVRTMFRSLLEKHRFKVCGEASNGKEAVEKVLELNPDIVLLDICMPVMNGIEAAHEIRRITPATRIVFLSAAAELMNDLQPISDGFVLKATAHSELIPTLNRLIDSRLKYRWQPTVMDALSETCRERLPAKINVAERTIDERLRTGPAPDIEEHCALSDALSALEDIASQHGPEELEDEGDENIA
jgi:DNA-binding NarL/FixJ family response regulator